VSTWFERFRGRGDDEVRDDALTFEQYVGLVSSMDWWGQLAPGITQTQTAQPYEAAPQGFVEMASRMFGSNSVVFAIMLARLSVFSAVRFQYQGYRNGRPAALFGGEALRVFERPWPGGSTAHMLTRMITDADLAGNAYLTNRRFEGQGPDPELTRLRPDWVDILLEPKIAVDPTTARPASLGWRKIGYVYYLDGQRDGDHVVLRPNEVAHFAPIPDPSAEYRGMSWLTPVIREMQADEAMTRHKTNFFRNAATPNMIVKHAPAVSPEKAREFKKMLDEEYAGPDKAGKTMHIGGGADITVVGKDMREIDLRAIQGAGETRLAAAGGVPPIIVGLSEGLQSATYSNYGQARRRYADGTLHPLWGIASAALEPLSPPASRAARLWYDARDVAFLREDSTDAAKIQQINAATIRTLVDAGFEPGSVVEAVDAQDMTLLVHSGRLSVQLQKPGETPDGQSLEGSSDTDDEDDDEETTP
jgi:phage portal protein BeeE